MTRMTYEDIETLTLAPYRALCAMGASPARAYARAVVPEIASGYLTNALYLLETNVRHSAILGYVGAGGIGLLLNEKISWREYGRVGAILVCLFVTVCCIEWLSHVLGRIIRGERSIPRGAKCAIWAAVLVCVVVCTAGIEAPDLAHTSKSVLAAMGTGLLHPDWGFFFGTGKDGLGWLLLETVGIALASTGLGALLDQILPGVGDGRAARVGNQRAGFPGENAVNNPVALCGLVMLVVADKAFFDAQMVE